MSDTQEPPDLSTLRRQAWDYFELHAGQRLTTFNFYIVISSVVSAAMMAGLQKDVRLRHLGFIPALLLVVLSLVFWRLDERNRTLIGVGESALKYFEHQSGLQGSGEAPHVANVFLREEFDTNLAKEKWFSMLRYWSYSKCFRAIFFFFGLVGAIGALFSLR